MSRIGRVRVELGDRGYEVCVGSGAIGDIASSLHTMREAGARRLFLVADTGVPPRFVDRLIGIADDQGMRVTVAPVTPTESIKTIETYRDLLEQIAETGHSRVDPVVALGGGIVGDLAGFIASSYRRGVPVIQCPTTLLSMVDASVGGKTGFNLMVSNPDGSKSLLKNLVGAFWQPSSVIADIDVLASLNQRQRRAGLSECIKHGFISASVGHAGFLDWMIENLDQIGLFDPGTMGELVLRNVSLKASVVAMDEREVMDGSGGARMLLNFGHTFGHAIETIKYLSPDPVDPSLAPLHHGEAVALGMIAACRAAEAHAGLDPAIAEELKGLLKWVGLPTKVDGLPGNPELIERMGHDKKTIGGEIRVILPTGRGECHVVDGVSSHAIGAGFDAIRG